MSGSADNAGEVDTITGPTIENAPESAPVAPPEAPEPAPAPAPVVMMVPDVQGNLTPGILVQPEPIIEPEPETVQVVGTRWDVPH